MEFGARLAQLRAGASLTQSELAERVGVSRRQIAYYESGTGRPPGALLGLLADLFQVSTDVLLGRAVQKAPASRLSRALLVRLRQVENLGADACRRFERVLERFVDEEQGRAKPARTGGPTRRPQARRPRRR
ncbi:MAG: helix-turn-helix transcriptional regulator [Steroidobacteraceae bacterium]|nr:helix-turn-helix transcriptional regulator [Steroidobacteraceae bacterium]